MQRLSMSSHYDDVYARSIHDPIGFWAEAAEEIHWYKKWKQIVDDSKGYCVIIYMPMIPEAVIAMLATARLGAIHSVVFGGFASHELAVRIDDARPKVVLTASCGIEPGRLVAYKPLVDTAIEKA